MRQRRLAAAVVLTLLFVATEASAAWTEPEPVGPTYGSSVRQTLQLTFARDGRPAAAGNQVPTANCGVFCSGSMLMTKVPGGAWRETDLTFKDKGFRAAGLGTRGAGVFVAGTRIGRDDKANAVTEANEEAGLASVDHRSLWIGVPSTPIAVATGPSRGGALTWSGRERTGRPAVFVARRSADRNSEGFARPVAVAAPAADRGTVAVNDQDDVAVAWARNGNLYMRTAKAEGRFGRVVSVGDVVDRARPDFAVAIDVRGRPVLAWHDRRQRVKVLRAGKTLPLGTAARATSLMAFGGRARATFTWAGDKGAQVATVGASGKPVVQRLTNGRGDRVTTGDADKNGRAAVLIERGDGSAVVARGTGGRFGAPESLPPQQGEHSSYSLALNPRTGVPTVIYELYDSGAQFPSFTTFITTGS
jgi:hypothetical protein